MALSVNSVIQEDQQQSLYWYAWQECIVYMAPFTQLATRPVIASCNIDRMSEKTSMVSFGKG
jgi:hypothetical protein